MEDTRLQAAAFGVMIKPVKGKARSAKEAMNRLRGQSFSQEGAIGARPRSDVFFYFYYYAPITKTVSFPGVRKT